MHDDTANLECWNLLTTVELAMVLAQADESCVPRGMYRRHSRILAARILNLNLESEATDKSIVWNRPAAADAA